ncbi:hypothetical protein LCGC14_1099000 [marine sediment metagenome]|uniref:Uncharacterized protein n=1 Tax=marine sediment metagenome TaxID=412755 RepID=A0A0F9MY18_9ZZZZ
MILLLLQLTDLTLACLLAGGAWVALIERDATLVAARMLCLMLALAVFGLSFLV